MIENLKSCSICPHMCKVNRFNGVKGRCKCDDKVKIGLASLHYFEEPCISSTAGSGTVFFSNCNLNCIFCQNYEISQLGKGKEFSINELANIFINQQAEGAENINLVSPTPYVYQIVEAIKIAKSNGLKIPILYNSNGYENVETIKLLNNYIDIYLPDFKYYSNKLAKSYSNIDNYFETATKSIQEMYFQVGLPKFNKNGIIKSGLIIRHLVLPNYLDNSKNVLKWIKDNMPRDVYVSIMFQYFPTYKAKKDLYINRKLTNEEYLEIKKYVSELNFKNGYIQDLGEHEEEYVPIFNLS